MSIVFEGCCCCSSPCRPLSSSESDLSVSMLLWGLGSVVTGSGLRRRDRNTNIDRSIPGELSMRQMFQMFFPTKEIQTNLSRKSYFLVLFFVVVVFFLFFLFCLRTGVPVSFCTLIQKILSTNKQKQLRSKAMFSSVNYPSRHRYS